MLAVEEGGLRDDGIGLWTRATSTAYDESNEWIPVMNDNVNPGWYAPSLLVVLPESFTVSDLKSSFHVMFSKAVLRVQTIFTGILGDNAAIVAEFIMESLPPDARGARTLNPPAVPYYRIDC
ncbi:hypothetical protein F5Y19DRAFT_469465 [Xylariaceae sp. FL1651]|nr:hypothetical protein F5Y19DRAFT_469465 [Xylariaceae sp. FL1651]